MQGPCIPWDKGFRKLSGELDVEAKQKALQGEISLTLQAGTRQQQSKTTEMTFRQKKRAGISATAAPEAYYLVQILGPGPRCPQHKLPTEIAKMQHLEASR